MVTRLSPDARKVLACAAQEARRRGDRRLGTDHLLLGLLCDPDSSAAAALGVDLAAARSLCFDKRDGAVRLRECPEPAPTTMSPPDPTTAPRPIATAPPTTRPQPTYVPPVRTPRRPVIVTGGS